ncbi:hypothetical protein LTR05_002472 [Lithohypha guttulata]|uniref:RING-type domain-containing protein n=1 Tax=Lithohypha guttulata TaxID=1690604 RepID=A0AAN7Y833_9EURO|nr:hypothetical protein LTR05_002472 [Lithohypha guttulata]
MGDSNSPASDMQQISGDLNPQRSQDCAICYEPFLAGQATLVHKTTCANAFHADCLLIWTKEHASCPACRRRIRIRPRESHPETDAWLERRYTVPAIHEAWQKYNIPPPIWFQSLGDLEELAKLAKLADFYNPYMASYITESLRLRCITTPVRRPAPLSTKIDPTDNSEQKEDDIQSQLGTHHARISKYWFKGAVNRLQYLSCGYILPTTPSEIHLEKHLFGQYFHETREALRLLVELGHTEAHALLDRTLGPPMVLRSESGGESVLVHRSSPEAIEAALKRNG